MNDASRRKAGAVACVALAAVSVAVWARGELGRRPVERFAKAYGFDVRRPDWLESARLEPTWDIEAAAMGDAAVRDELGSVSWAELTPELREAWMDSFARREEMLRAATGMVLDALGARPGWPFHRLLVGQLAYLAERRAGATEVVAKAERWMVPLRRAVEGAPGADQTWSFLGGAMLDAWDGLPDPARSDVPKVLKRAFLDPAFVGLAFLPAARALGTDEALAMVPSDPVPLRSVRDQLARSGDVPGAAKVQERWEAAELDSRSTGLARIEARFRMGDAEGVGQLCRTWASRHTPWDRDVAAGRTQSARVLEVWPMGASGAWRSDPRGELVRFFLGGRERDVRPEAMQRAVSSLLAVPVPVQARVALMAGNRYEVDRLLHDGQESLGSLDWTPFFVDLALDELKARKVEAAEAALGRVARTAREECAVLLARRAVAEAGDDRQEVAGLKALIAEQRAAPIGPEAWSTSGSLSLCVDPAEDAGRQLMVSVRTEKPALVSWGWNGGRLGTRLVDGAATIEAPLEGLRGRALFRLEGAAPGAVQVTGALVVEAMGTATKADPGAEAASALPR